VPLTTLSTSNATKRGQSRICSARHGDGARVVVNCRCPKAATHWPTILDRAVRRLKFRYVGSASNRGRILCAVANGGQCQEAR
jgi:hypothetical protein